MTAPARRTLFHPGVIIVAGCLIAIISFGTRGSMGLFLAPMSETNGWGREVFGLAMALQNLCWGIVQPFAGALADKFGPARVLALGGIVYGFGLCGIVITSHFSLPSIHCSLRRRHSSG